MKTMEDAIEHRKRADLCESVELSGDEWREWLDSFIAVNEFVEAFSRAFAASQDGHIALSAVTWDEAVAAFAKLEGS